MFVVFYHNGSLVLIMAAGVMAKMGMAAPATSEQIATRARDENVSTCTLCRGPHYMRNLDSFQDRTRM